MVSKNALYFGFRSKLNDGVPDTFVVGVSICMSLDFNHHTLYCNQAHCFTGDKLGCVKALRRNIRNSAMRDNVSTRLQVTSLVCLLVCLRDQIKADRQLGLVTTATTLSAHSFSLNSTLMYSVKYTPYTVNSTVHKYYRFQKQYDVKKKQKKNKDEFS